MIPSWSLLPYIPWIKNKNLEIDYTKLKAKSYFNTMKKKKTKKEKNKPMASIWGTERANF